MDEGHRQKILVISFSNLSSDQRIKRQLESLAPHFSVSTIGYGTSGINGVAHYDCQHTTTRKVGHLLSAGVNVAAGRYENFYWSRPKIKASLDLYRFHALKPDLILANEIDAMPLALKMADGAKVVLDLHEYYPGEWEDKLWWKLLLRPYKTFLCKKYIPRADAVFTVCEGIAEAYKELCGVKPLVLNNASPFVELAPTPVGDSAIKLVYHGLAVEGRNIEKCLAIMNDLDSRFTLDLLLVPGNPAYIDYLKKLARDNPRIRFVEPQPSGEVIPFTNNYDIGLFLLPPVNLNYKFALPNKLFEFLQARLAVAIGPSKEMASVVRNYDCGVIADDFAPASLAKKLNALTKEKITYYKNQAHAAALEENASKNGKLLYSTVSGLIEGE